MCIRDSSDRTQILREIKAKNIESSKIDDFRKADRWIDYQYVFKKRFHLDRCYSLEEDVYKRQENIAIDTPYEAWGFGDVPVQLADLVLTLSLIHICIPRQMPKVGMSWVRV